MKDELKYSFKNLNEAVKRLDEGVEQTENQLDRDGVIQRFEFTFELLWKTLKLFLAEEGILTKSPKEALKETFKFGMIKNESLFFDMLEDRNQTSHIYSEEISLKIYNRIKKGYLPVIKKLIEEISERID